MTNLLVERRNAVHDMVELARTNGVSPTYVIALLIEVGKFSDADVLNVESCLRQNWKQR